MKTLYEMDAEELTAYLVEKVPWPVKPDAALLAQHFERAFEVRRPLMEELGEGGRRIVPVSVTPPENSTAKLLGKLETTLRQPFYNLAQFSMFPGFFLPDQNGWCVGSLFDWEEVKTGESQDRGETVWLGGGFRKTPGRKLTRDLRDALTAFFATSPTSLFFAPDRETKRNLSLELVDRSVSNVGQAIAEISGGKAKGGYLVLSAHPLDVLFASQEGTATFTSCQRIGGEYWPGILQYMLMPRVLVAYWYPEGSVGIYQGVPVKHWRSFLYTDNAAKPTAFLQTRVYGTEYETMNGELRALLSSFLGVDLVRRDASKHEARVVVTTDGGAHPLFYFDRGRVIYAAREDEREYVFNLKAAHLLCPVCNIPVAEPSRYSLYHVNHRFHFYNYPTEFPCQGCSRSFPTRDLWLHFASGARCRTCVPTLDAVETCGMCSLVEPVGVMTRNLRSPDGTDKKICSACYRNGTIVPCVSRKGGAHYHLNDGGVMFLRVVDRGGYMTEECARQSDTYRLCTCASSLRPHVVRKDDASHAA